VQIERSNPKFALIVVYFAGIRAGLDCRSAPRLGAIVAPKDRRSEDTIHRCKRARRPVEVRWAPMKRLKLTKARRELPADFRPYRHCDHGQGSRDEPEPCLRAPRCGHSVCWAWDEADEIGGRWSLRRGKKTGCRGRAGALLSAGKLVHDDDDQQIVGVG
jgi:hypothetical protein